jgi:undecaprenyl-phosphate 4-deoxy-4-formamido-L-arabinose transferase
MNDETGTAIRLSVVVPMFDEERNIDSLLTRLLATCEALPYSWEVVCVNDGSRDRTAAVVRTWQERHPQVVLVDFSRNFGQHAAVTAGFAYARGDWIVTLDADLQNPPEEVPKIAEQLAAGHDLVNTVRMDRQDTFFRRWASGVTNRAVRRMSGIKLSDFGCMLRGYSREVAMAIVEAREYKTFIPALATFFARYPTEVKVAHAPRAAGESKYPFFKLLSLQLDLVTSFSVYPLRLLFRVGMFFAASGIGLGILIFILRLVRGVAWANQGTLTLLGALFIFCGVQFLAFGLLGEYIGRIFQQVRLREHYLVRSVERPGAPESAQSPLTSITARSRRQDRRAQSPAGEQA